jgi:hypothetical protein
MLRGYETLLAADTKVDVQTAMAAASKLQAIIESREGQADAAQIYVQMNRIIDAMKSTVPEELWPEILRKLEGEAEPVTGDHDEDLEADEDEYDPAEFAEDDDDDDF